MPVKHTVNIEQNFMSDANGNPSILKTIVDGLPLPAFVCDTEFNLVFENAECCALFNDEEPLWRQLLSEELRFAKGSSQFSLSMPEAGTFTVTIKKHPSPELNIYTGQLQKTSFSEQSRPVSDNAIAAFRRLPEMLHAIDENGKLIFVSDKWLETLGYQEHEVLGVPSIHFLTPASQVKAREEIATFFQKGFCENVAFQMVCKNGNVIDVLLSATLAKDHPDAEAFAVAIITDVTEKLQAQTLLEERSQRLEHIIEGTGAGTWEWNVQTGQTKFNARWAEILGYRWAELAPVTIDTWLALTHPDDVKRAELSLEEHVAGGSDNYECQARMKHKDGSWVWVMNRGKVLSWTPDGKPEWMFGFHLDITYQMRQQQTLKQNELFLRRAGEVAGLGGWELDLRENQLYWSEQTHKLHEVEEGYVPEVETALEFYPPEARPVITEAVQRAIEHGEKWDLELPFVTAKGNAIWVHAVGEPVFENDEIVRLIGTFSDVTDAVKIRQELEDKRREAELILAERSKLFAKVSHEIRTPLNGITGMLVTSIDENDEVKRKSKLELALRSADQLLNIINESLDYSKICHGELLLEPSQFALRQLFDDIATLYAETAERKGLQFISDIEVDAALWVNFDATRLGQIVSNLLNNAVKFTETGSVTLRIAATTSTDNVMLSLEVSDTGIGIDNSMLGKLFTPFTQASTEITSKYGGTGLGLSIVHELVQTMGGNIEVQSIQGKGTNFVVRLCLPIGAKQSEKSAAEMVDADFSSLSVLVADDNDINRMVMEAILESLSIVPDFAVDGQDAIDKCHSKQYDIIFMDCMMPEVDGLAATRWIRQSNLESNAAFIVALTANSSDEDRQACRDAGMDAFLSKPVQLKKIQEVLVEHVEQTQGTNCALSA